MGGLLSALEVVGGAAMMFVPGGQIAGAMMITAGVASSGLIGGSVGKFLNSGLGQGLMAAVSLGSAAVAMYGADAAQAAAGAAAEQAATAGDISANAATDADAAVTNTSLMNDTAVSNDVSQVAASDPTLSAVSGTTPGSDAAAYAGTPSAPPGTTGPGAAGSQAFGQTTATDTAAPKPLAGSTASNNLVGSTAPPGANPATGGANASGTPLVGDTQPGSPLAGGGTAGSDQLGVPQSDIGTKVPPGGVPATNPGLLSQAASFVGKNPGVAVAGGQMLSGIAQGAAQEKAMQEQLAAQQWGNLQWQNPTEVNQLQAAAAAPITVPQGYLQRAQQVRGLMTGATPSPGVQPMAVAGAAPGAPLAPKLPGQA